VHRGPFSSHSPGDAEQPIRLDAQLDVQDELLRARYRAWAPRYDRAFRRYSEVTLAKAIDLLGTPFPRRVLDLACGTGLLTESILRRAPSVHVIGVDLSEDMLAHARARVAAFKGSDVQLLVGRAERLPLAGGSVDAIVIANAFHLVHDPDAALHECRRALCPGGRLVIIDWCRDALPIRLLALALRIGQRLERRIEGLGALARRVTSAGFFVERGERFTAPPLWGLMAFVARRSDAIAASQSP
jgi:ubiquinone/menaquinone biosynthesis C-methylase UbiE